MALKIYRKNDARKCRFAANAPACRGWRRCRAAVRDSHRRDFLRDELAHRLKNTLAMVQSIAARTFGECRGMDAFLARIHALGEAHDVLLHQSWNAVPIRQMIGTLLAPHGDRFDPDGPDVQLGPRTTVALSLVLHELATNAVKYGVLSGPAGRVALHWQLKGDELLIHWRESGGPPVSPPAQVGFGTRLIDMGLSGTGHVERRYPAAGVEVDLHVARGDLRT